MMRTFGLVALVAAVAAVLLCGCSVAPRKEYPVRRHYVLDVKRVGDAAKPATDAVARVRRVRPSPIAAGTELVYRIDDVGYETDFYNRFLTAPAGLITAEIRQWLQASEVFANVVDDGSRIDARYTIECSLLALHADYREPKAPAAVMDLQVFLVDDKDHEGKVVFHQTYRQTAKLSSTSPPALVKGFSRCLRDALAALEKDLAEGIR